jgi:hypothetical protein
MTNQIPRAYRKKFNSDGTIVYQSKQYPIEVVNMSTSGLLVALTNTPANYLFKEIEIPHSEVIDVYVNSLSLSVAAQIIRIENNNNEILLALNFLDDTLHYEDNFKRRKSGRINKAADANILIGGEFLDCKVLNHSDNGAKIFVSNYYQFEIGTDVIFKFDEINLITKASVIWCESGKDGVILGLDYL